MFLSAHLNVCVRVSLIPSCRRLLGTTRISLFQLKLLSVGRQKWRSLCHGGTHGDISFRWNRVVSVSPIFFMNGSCRCGEPYCAQSGLQGREPELHSNNVSLHISLLVQEIGTDVPTQSLKKIEVGLSIFRATHSGKPLATLESCHWQSMIISASVHGATFTLSPNMPVKMIFGIRIRINSGSSCFLRMEYFPKHQS